MSMRDEIIRLKNNVMKDIVGQEEIVERLIMGLLANGNLLVEGLPGMAKTRAIKSLASNIEGSYGRIQFTPDLVQSDIVGRQAYYEGDKGGKGEFVFEPGPVFNNIVLADEINRAPSKTQNALLEAMEERQVTVAAVAHKMPDLFLVMATQNPVEQAGTYPLPEAQMDRFLMHVSVHYPDEVAEAQIIRLVRGEFSQEQKARDKDGVKEKKKLTAQDTIFAARGEMDKVTVPDHVEKYMVDLVFTTRYPERFSYELKSFIKCGASPRGSLALDRCSRAHAWMRGESEAGIEDVQAVVHSVLRHRLIRGDRAHEHKVTADDIIDDILEKVQIPAVGDSYVVKKAEA